MTINKLFYFLFIIYFFFSCKNVVLNEIEKQIDTHPVETLTKLENLLPLYESMKNSEKAKFGLLYFMALDKNDLPLTPISLLDFSIDFYEASLFHNNKQAYTYLYKARAYYYDEMYNKAIDYLLSALKKADNNDKSLLGKIYFDLGLINYYKDAYDNAIHYYEKALSHFNETDEITNIAVTNICLGEIMRILNDNGKAQIYFENALSISDDLTVKGDIFYQLSESYYSLAQYDSALHLIKESLRYPSHEGNKALRLLQTADIFYAMEVCDSSFVYAMKSLEHPSSHYIKKDTYKLLVDIFSKKNDHSNTNKYLSIYNCYVDTVLRYEKESPVKIAEDLHEIKYEKNRINRHRYSLLFLFFALLISSCFLYRYVRKKYLLKIQTQKQENTLAFKRKELIHNINDAKVKVQSDGRCKTCLEREIAIREIYNRFLHIDDYDLFLKLMNELYGNTTSHFIEEYSQLNEKNIKYVFLLLLEVPVEDIYVILEYKAESLKKMRYRLAPKLSISSAKELNNFIFSYFFRE